MYKHSDGTARVCIIQPRGRRGTHEDNLEHREAAELKEKADGQTPKQEEIKAPEALMKVLVVVRQVYAVVRQCKICLQKRAPPSKLSK